MIKLDQLAISKPQTTATPIDLTDMVALPGFAPRDYQSTAPPACWQGNKAAIPDSPDLRRILRLPRRPVPEAGTARAEALIDVVTARYARASGPCNCASLKRACIKRLNRVQAWALHEIATAGGLIGQIVAGGGKTVCDVLSPLAVPECRLALLLVPPGLLDQLIREYQLLSQHFRVPSLVVHGRSYSAVSEGEPVLHVLAYSRLSRPEATTFLRTLRPDTIISDECFPGSTLVQTDEGALTIAEIVDKQRGTFVLAGSGRWRRIVKRIHRTSTKQFVRVVHEHGSFVCTEDHKIWTEGRGYVEAKGLKRQIPASTERSAAHQAVSMVRGNVSSEAAVDELLLACLRLAPRESAEAPAAQLPALRGSVPQVGGEDGVLRAFVCQQSEDEEQGRYLPGVLRPVQENKIGEILQCRMSQNRMYQESHHEPEGSPHLHRVRGGVPHEISREDYSSVLLSWLRSESRAGAEAACVARGEGVRVVDENENQKPVIRTRGAGKNYSQAQGQDVSFPRRQWAIDEAATFARSTVETPMRVADQDKVSSRAVPIVAGLLQGRPSGTFGEACDRSGWTNAQDEKMEVLRSAQDFCTRRSRVVRVEVLERGSVGGDGSRVFGDHVYDLEVEIEHNYFADGVLVSNCHRLRHPQGAGCSRVLSYVDDFRSTRFLGWTGSMTDSTPKDYSHLSAMALRGGSPLPLDPNVTDDWARALDPTTDYPAPPGALLDLCEPGEHLYSGFRRRLTETLGVVATTEMAIDADLEITERQAPPIPPLIQDYLTALRTGDPVRPDGEELVTPLEISRTAHELACGLYLRWIYPRGEAREVIDEWFVARKEWRRELRVKLRDRREHLDSPKLCALAAMRAHGQLSNDHGLPEWKSETWLRWHKAKPTVKPETQAVRVDDYLARDAAAWAHEQCGIVWYSTVAFGEWVAEISRLPLHGGGPGADARIMSERGDRSIIASIKSHGTGRDGLQHLFVRQLIASPPTSATEWEQVLARLYRLGQVAPKIWAKFYCHTPELAANVDEALCRAEYVHGTWGSSQKIRTFLRRPGAAAVDPWPQDAHSFLK